MFRRTPAPRCAQIQCISTFGYRTGKLADKEVRRVFRHIDDDKSGEINLEELVAFVEDREPRLLMMGRPLTPA